MRSTLLVLAGDQEVLNEVAAAARDAGFTVSPSRFHELAIDSLTRVPATVALVHVMHEGADSIAFSALAQFRGTKVFLFTNRNGPIEEHARVSLVSSRSPFPVLEYSGSPAELVAAVEAAMRPQEAGG